MEGQFDSAQLLAETEKQEEQQGWLATFADLMSLLMCFFVLLLSFSELDVVKFKQIAGSMKQAFGVQRDIEAESVPLGTSVIAQEFSAGSSAPTLLDEVRQQTQDEPSAHLVSGSSDDHRASEVADLQHRLEQALGDELQRGQLELEASPLGDDGQQLIIRIQESGAFASGSGYLQPRLIAPLERIAELLADVPGQIRVAGHTDNQPVSNELFQDNLALAAARALAVARVLKSHPQIRWVDVSALGDAQPLVPNSNAKNRAKNRRVEIMIMQGKPAQTSLSGTAWQGGK